MKDMKSSGEDTPIRLTSVNMVHSPPCNPSSAQFSQCMKKGGTIMKLLSPERLHQLSEVLGLHQHIPLPLARTLLEQVFPTNWDLDSNTVNNFIVKCRIYRSITDSTKPVLKPNINIPGKLELVGISQQDLIDKSLLVSWDCLQEHLKEEGQSWCELV